jgi:hypothetical protein
MSDPETEHAAGRVIPQTPVVSNYGLVLTVYILYLIGFLTGITVLVGVGDRLSSKRQNGSGIPITFPVSDNNILDWTSVFFRWASDAALCNRRSNFALVGSVDRD